MTRIARYIGFVCGSFMCGLQAGKWGHNFTNYFYTRVHDL